VHLVGEEEALPWRDMSASAFADISSETAAIIGAVLVIVASTLLFFVSKTKQNAGSVLLDDLLLDTNEIQWDDDKDSTQTATPAPKDLIKKEAEDNCDSSSPQKEDNSEEEPKLKNVFDVKQNPPNVGKAQDAKGVEKPFKSSYYYAHNQHRKTGGYKDGLKAEDYVMNGPKLLTKGSSMETSTHEITTSAQAATKLGKGNSTPINRYLWDDDGNENGIAKIYVDSLPGKGSASSISWAEGNITKNDVMSKLVGVWKNGLIVQIRSSDTRYHLHVPRMYGEVEDVKIIVKHKKMIVKLTKKKQKENLKSWPQLPSKVATGSTDGADYVNEDLFLQE